ncbi:hypothetical protein ABPG74_001986 [Tetrahymena malaccensis]
MSKKELRLNLQQLQQSYIALCLKTSKAHFQLSEFVKIQNDQVNSDVISHQQLGHVKVYDSVEKKYKMLIICLSVDFEKYNQFYQEVTKKCIRTDIYMKIIDQYYLDENKMFYVFEMEYFSSTLTEFKDQFQLEAKTVKKIKKSLQKFYEKNVHIFYEYHLLDIQQYYVNLNDKKQLQVKFNLIDPNWKIEQYLKNQLQLGYIKQNFNEKNIILQQKRLEKEMECEKQEERQEIIYSNDEILQMFQEFYFKKCIQKSNLLKVIQEKFENILKVHPIEMIEIISNHPLYDDFKVVYSNEHIFELKAKKRGQTIMLQAHCIQNLQKAEEILSVYTKILADNKISSTILGVELLVFEKQNYILVEKKYNNHIQKSYKNFSKLRQSEFKVFNFINFSYQLLAFSDIQITKINPLNLLLLEGEYLIYNIEQKYQEAEQYLQMKNVYEQQLEIAKTNFKKIERKLIVEKFTLSNQDFSDNKQNKLEEENLQNDQYVKQLKSQKAFKILHEEIPQQVQEILDDPKYMNYTIDEVSLNNFCTEYIEIINEKLNEAEKFRSRLEEQSYEKSLFQDLIKQFFEKIAENQIESVKILYEKIRMGFINYIYNAVIQVPGSYIKYYMDFLISKTNLRNTKFSIKSSEMQSQVFSYILSLQVQNKIFQISSLRLPINTVQISCITFEGYGFYQLPKLTPFYKLKRLVSVNLKKITLEDKRED